MAAALLAAEWYARSSVAPARPALETARAVGEAVRPHPGASPALLRRLDRSVTTGFLLTIALACSLVGGVLLGVLVYLVRSVPALQNVDNSAAAWGYDHRSSFSTSGLHVITEFGSIQIAVGLALVLAAIDFHRTRSRWSLPFLLTVLAGMELLMHGVKDLVGRVRPALGPPPRTSGRFPTAIQRRRRRSTPPQLILGRTLQRRPRHVVLGLAVRNRRRGRRQPRAPRPPLALRRRRAVLGWGWFALCAGIFGGRLLGPTAGVRCRRPGQPRKAKARDSAAGVGPVERAEQAHRVIGLPISAAAATAIEHGTSGGRQRNG
jgi:hypothetical protein